MLIVRRTTLVLTFAVALVTLGCGEAADTVETAAQEASAPAAESAPPMQSAPAPDTLATEAAPAPADPGDAVLGYWYSEGDESQILIAKAENGEIEGQIVWLESPNYDEEGDEELGKPRRDRNNPDDELQKRPIVGLSMIQGFTYDAGEEQWTGGSIYDPESGKTYKCQMKLGENDTLDVRGYIGIPALGRSTTWRRVPDGEEKNDVETPAATPSA